MSYGTLIANDTIAIGAARAENATWSAHAALLRSSGDSWSLLSMAGVGELGRAARGWSSCASRW